jgi:hypothetical protein
MNHKLTVIADYAKGQRQCKWVLTFVSYVALTRAILQREMWLFSLTAFTLKKHEMWVRVKQRIRSPFQ